ncbi:hypothetical protein V8E54_011217 [Elaphomyces granulatus]
MFTDLLRSQTNPKAHQPHHSRYLVLVPTSNSAAVEPPSLSASSDSSNALNFPRAIENEGSNIAQGSSSAFALPYRIVYAVAIQDTVIISDTQQQTPLCVVSNLHFAAFTDLSWSNDGLMLIVSSSDGFCSTLSFSPGELGQPYVAAVSATSPSTITYPTSPTKSSHSATSSISSGFLSKQDNSATNESKKEDTTERNKGLLPQPTEMNPDMGVALATEILSSFYPKDILRHSRFPSMHLKHGLNAHVNERTASVLDAIAAICVAKSKSDVVAVALKLTLPTVCFVIAANDERRGPNITDHLRTAWGILKDISDLAGSNDDEEVKMDVESPEESEILRIYIFYYHIYTFCHAKVIRRYNNHKPILESFYQMIKKLDADNNYILDIQDLISVTEAIIIVLENFNNPYNKAKEIQCIGELLDSQYETAERILNWIPLFENDINYQERSIRKIISFPSQVRSLLRWVSTSLRKEQADASVV